MNVMLVVGLPGSGKTHWASAQVAQFCAMGVTAWLLDDPRTQEQLVEGLSRQGQVLFITDPYLCNPQARVAAQQALENAGHTVSMVFFANDPVQCRLNAVRRQDLSVLKFIDRLARGYEVPEGAMMLPVYRGAS